MGLVEYKDIEYNSSSLVAENDINKVISRVKYNPKISAIDNNSCLGIMTPENGDIAYNTNTGEFFIACDSKWDTFTDCKAYNSTNSYEPHGELKPMICTQCGGKIRNRICTCCGTEFYFS